MKRRVVLFIITAVAAGMLLSAAQSEETLKIARLKYGGGGDWYSNPTSLPNLAKFVNENTELKFSDEESVVSLSGGELFKFPVVYMNGHGNINFTPKEASLLRQYLLGGGFLFADDNYGMDKSFRREMKKVFPENELVLLPTDHPIFNVMFQFPGGLPKIHEHDGLPAQAYAIFHDGRIVVFYSYQSDLGDGWEDPSVHGDPEDLRISALKMGANVLIWALTH
jgi:hypothetical protein